MQIGLDWFNFVAAEMRDFIGCHPPARLLQNRGETRVGCGLADGAQFLTRAFSNQAGNRPYKLYVPSGYNGQPAALVVMLHGCTQSPDDFAAGTGMNVAAEEQVFLVAYPGQTTSANAQRCWEWYSAENQQRGKGEPSLIAGITCQIMQDYAVDPRRVYVAGLSAGGATAAVLGETYPDLYAAIGVHSGLACGAASNLSSALAAMNRGSVTPTGSKSGPGGQPRRVPAIVFHGDRDATVSPRNGGQVSKQFVGDAPSQTQVLTGHGPGGHAYSHTVQLDENAQPRSELWLVHGAGHAWSGGSAAGSYTDPHGPDATREMLRFFREHPLASDIVVGIHSSVLC